jgi:hypothetical protein
VVPGRGSNQNARQKLYCCAELLSVMRPTERERERERERENDRVSVEDREE